MRKNRHYSTTDVYTGTQIKLASHMGLSVSTLDMIVKNCEVTERSYTQCGSYSKQQKSLKNLPMAKLEAALAARSKQLHEGNASTDGTQLKKKALHTAVPLGTAKFSASNGRIDRFKRRHNIVYGNLSSRSRSVDSETTENWKKWLTITRDSKF